MSTENRIHWIDSLKTIGILAVILGHIASPLSAFIFSWHMPLFFMISGFFLKFNLSYKEFIVKNFKRLMIPYFIFAFIGIGLEAVKRILINKESLNYFNESYGIFIGMDMSSLINSYAFILWFLPALFFGKLILFIINKTLQNLLYQAIIILVLFLISFHIELPFGIDNALNSMFWIFSGYLYFNIGKNIPFNYTSNIFTNTFGFSLLGIMIIIGLYLYSGIPSLDLASKNYQNIIINILWGFSIIYLFILILKNININNSFIHNWGSNTMLLFILHPYTNNLSYYIIEEINIGGWYLKFGISLILLQIILSTKGKFKNSILFKYL